MEWAEFLAKVPPGVSTGVENVIKRQPGKQITSIELNVPDIETYCDNAKCKGERVHAEISRTGCTHAGHGIYIIQYICRNCGESIRSIGVTFESLLNLTESVNAIKFGEFPLFGPPVPPRVITLIGPDRDLFLKGRRSELQGLGVGAFAYYRQVVEQQKDRLVSEIAKVAKKTGADETTLLRFERALKEPQFSKAVDEIKDAIPQALLINGQNPLKLLHTALSEGIHNGTDEECLAIATSIRVILTDLSERISVVLKETSELRTALSRLMNRTKAKKQD